MSDFKQTQKSMKGPDEFQVQVMTWLDYMVKYKNAVIAVVGATAVVLIGAWGFKSFLETRTMKRQLAVTDVDIVYQEELDKVSKGREELQKQMDAATATVDKPDSDPAKKAEVEAKTKVIQDQMKAIKPDHSQSKEKYKAVYEQFKQHPEGWLAGVRYASILLKDRKLEESKALLSEILKASRANTFFQVQGGLMYVGILEDLKDYDTALAETEKLLKVVPGDLKAKLLLTKGRIQMAKQQGPEAKQTLDSVIKDYGSSPEAERARGMKAIIN